NIAPRQIIILPLVHNGYTEGVLELGFMKEVSEDAQELLREVSDNIAIGLNAAKNKARLQELLEETQAQSEELQAQHAELENMNTELEAQAQKLQASEEELRVQQEELQQSNVELEERSRLLEDRNQLILERNLDIQKKAEELELSTKYKSEFLANMSHELRTPLNSILLLSRLLAENNTNNLSDDQVEYARVIQSSGNGLLALIDEILDLSKIEAGKMDLEYHRVFVDEITQDIHSLFDPIARDRGLDLHIIVSPDMPRSLETDKMRVDQILRNLLSNALKFTTKGSVTLEAAAVAGKPGFISFTVRDTGIGIPKEKHLHVFEAFQQADGSTKRKFGGTGLGLSISRQLARLLGGDIILESEPGKGSSFS
ncbi:histidine kinase, partial [archaeon]